MAFVYEEVGLENKELWESIGWKDWGNNPLAFSQSRKWCIDREREVYLQSIGGFIDMPEYHDLSYKGVIVRIEAFALSGKTSMINGQRKTELIWYVDNIYIPNSLWDMRQEVLKLIEEAFMADTYAAPPSRIKRIKVVFRCEPTHVEVDYNGR